jgi:hypothetical protein
MNRLAYKYIFLGSFPQNTSKNMASGYGIIFNRPSPTPGSIIALTLQSDFEIIDGQMIAVPTINGIALTEDLSVILTFGLDFGCQAIPENTPGYQFSANDQLGIKLTSDSNWDNQDGNLMAYLYLAI